MKQRTKFLLIATLIVFITCLGAVAASDASDDQSATQTAVSDSSSDVSSSANDVSTSSSSSSSEVSTAPTHSSSSDVSSTSTHSSSSGASDNSVASSSDASTSSVASTTDASTKTSSSSSNSVSSSSSNKDIDYPSAVSTQLNTTKKIDTDSVVEQTKTIKTDDETNDTAITITDSNYNIYFNNNGVNTNNVVANSTLILSGAFDNKTFSITKEGVTLTGDNAVLTGGSIYVGGDADNAAVSNIFINTTNEESAIYVDTNNVTVTNNTVYLSNEDGITEGISILGDNCTVTNNTVYVEGPSVEIDWAGGDRQGLANTIGIINWGGNNVIIDGNTIYSTKTPGLEDEGKCTITGLDVKQASNVTVSNNDITVTGSRFVYALDVLDSVYNITLTGNTLKSYGYRYTDGIQIGNSASGAYIYNNTIIGICYNDTIYTGDDEAMSFGIITTTMGGYGSTDNMYIYDNIILLNSTITYGLEIYTTSDSIVANNFVNNTGNYSMGMSLAHSQNITVTGNQFYTQGNSSVYINPIVEEIPPANTGIQIQQNSTNAVITNNTAICYDCGDESYGDPVMAVIVDRSQNATVTDNILLANELTGDDAVKTSGDVGDTIIKDNTAPEIKGNATITITNPTLVDTGTTVTFQAEVTDSVTGEKIDGRLVFKLNGVTLKDEDGNKITLTVKDGIASLDYSLAGFSAKDYTLTAVFASDDYDRTEISDTLTIQKVNVVLDHDFSNLTAYAGQTISINDTVYDENGNQLSGTSKVCIKINGKTITNELRIVDGVLVGDLTIPDGLRAGTNNITIIVGENNRYNELRIDTTLDILPQDVVIDIEPLTAKAGEYVTLTASITNAITNTPVTSGNYGFKINGQTLTDVNEFGQGTDTVQSITDGVATIHTYIDAFMDDGEYDITVTYSGSINTNEARNTTTALTIST